MVRLTSVYNDGWVFQHIDHDALEKVDVLSHRSQTTKVLGCGAGILYFFHISGEEHVVALQPTDVFLSPNRNMITMQLHPDFYGFQENYCATSNCNPYNYWVEDSFPFKHMLNVPYTGAAVALSIKNVEAQVMEDNRIQKFSLTTDCRKQLTDAGYYATQFANFGSVYNITVRDHSHHTCLLLKGTWIVISYHPYRTPHNLFDLLSTEWYHIWLLIRHIQHDKPRALYITHAHGSAHGHLYFPEIYSFLGIYQSWEEIVGHAHAHGKRCMVFEEMISIGTGWLWMKHVLDASSPSLLPIFVEELVKHLNISEVPAPMNPTQLILASRRNAAWRPARSIINEVDLAATLTEALPNYQIVHTDLGTLQLSVAARLVRTSSILVFPHGGAGPNLLWMHKGAVVVELFPYMTADPMYRNLAVLTGKTYVSWQAQQFLDTSTSTSTYTLDYHISRASSFLVNVSEVVKIICEASSVVKTSMGKNWLPTNSDHFSLSLQPWALWPSLPND